MNRHAGSRPGIRIALIFALMTLLCSCHGSYHERRVPVNSVAEARTVRDRYAHRVDRVLARLLPCVPKGTCRTYGIISSAVPNASVDSRGTLKLTTGLIEFSNTDDLLAFAIAHELGHAVRRHPWRNARNNWLQFILTGAAMWAANEWGDSKSGTALTGAGIFLTTSLFGTLPDRRRMESEADLTGKEILIRAGYDPHAAAAFWRRYARARPDRPRPVWLSKHPSDTKRAEALAR
jgi:Zn-dependent protease with chaperone function